MKIRHCLLLAGAGALLTSCGTPPKRISTSVIKPPDVLLTVRGNPQALVITTPGMPDCEVGHQGNGCLRVKQNESAVITFKLTGSADWSISWFLLCYGDTKPTSDTCTLQSPTNLEFVAKADGVYYQPILATGRITFDPSDDVREFVLYDNNWTQRDYYYVIQACKEDGTCLATDPIIENDGSTISAFAW